MEFQEFPKWVYPAGIKEAYAPGDEPVLVGDAAAEAAVLGQVANTAANTAPEATPKITPKRRGRPPKDAA